MKCAAKHYPKTRFKKKIKCWRVKPNQIAINYHYLCIQLFILKVKQQIILAIIQLPHQSYLNAFTINLSRDKLMRILCQYRWILVTYYFWYGGINNKKKKKLHGFSLFLYFVREKNQIRWLILFVLISFGARQAKFTTK